MLSKIKSSETRATSLSHSTTSDNEEEVENDKNNNNDESYNQAKKSQDELLDIVEVSRKRRLSRDSADSLTGFIRWSFSHSPLYSDHPFAKRAPISHNKQEKQDEDMLDDEDEWVSQQSHQFQANNRFQVPEQLLRQHAKLSASSGGSSAINLALIKATNDSRHLCQSSLLSESARQASKRARTQTFSPESHKFSTSHLNNNNNNNKSSGYLGNVVERLHLQQQQQQQQSQHQEVKQELDPDPNSASGLSFHLQQFLQQQTSLEDLCSSVRGLDDNNQLALAAVIQQALLDSVESSSQLAPADTKSTASSLGSSSGASSSYNNNNNNNNNNNHRNANLDASGANLNLVDLMNRQRRAYNTRAALHGITSSNRQQASSAMNMSSRMQQQRHAQAAAALSALASVGSHPHQLTSGAPIVDFKCDTCPSSFDDRHRLMQHQSIHLELKKDWFTETPVDEVMKIFNRRRGEFLCNICNLRFEATLDYDQHNHSVHGPRPYCCQFCGNGTRTFKCWRQYLNHLYDHRYIFSCTIDDCDFTVNRRDSLRFHIFRFHLNCQLPQNNQQQQQVKGNNNNNNNGHNLLVGANNNADDSKWLSMEDDDDTENEMNVAD